MGRIDTISEALETEHGFDLSTGKIVNVDEHKKAKEIVMTPADILNALDDDTGELGVFGDDDDEENLEENTEVVLSTVNIPTVQKEELDQSDIDYNQDESLVKENLKALIEKSMDMADEMIEIVRISETPKAFDSAANFIRAVAELNEKLLDIHDRKDKRKAGKKGQANQPSALPTPVQNNNTQNNTIICKDPAEILKMLNSETN